MKHLALASLSVLVAVSQAAAMSWLNVLPVMLIMFNKPAEGFFGIFRRRQPAEPPVIKETPQNPFMSGFPPQGQNFFNPFGGSGSGGFFPGMQRPNFPGSFPGFQGFMGQPWGQNLGIPPRTQMSQFSQMPPRSQLPPFSQVPPQQQTKSQSSEVSNFESKEQSMDSNGDLDSNDFNEDGSFNSENFNENQDFSANQEFDSNQNFDGENHLDDTPPPINTEEAESFFTLLAETDENKCISRLVCEMGADPDTAGDLGRTVNDIIGSLKNFPPGSRVSEYNEILNKGRSQGLSACVDEYSICDEETYNLMKSNQPEE